MSAATLPGEILEDLARYDSATVASVIDMIGIRSRCAGYVDRSIRPLFPQLPAAVGYAVTATFRAAGPADATDRPTTFLNLIKRIHASPRPRIVVIQDLDEPVAAAAFGEVMAACFQLHDCRGVLTNGAARQIDHLAKLRLPCWASGTVVSHGYGHLCALDEPVRVGGLEIRPGDLLHGDCSGVLQVPLDLAPALPALCAQWYAAERIPLAHAAAGDPDLAAYIKMTTAFKAAFGELAARAGQVAAARTRRD